MVFHAKVHGRRSLSVQLILWVATYALFIALPLEACQKGFKIDMKNLSWSYLPIVFSWLL